MELRHLRYFVAAAEAENVSRAALKLHVSQPAVSRQIRDLEEELGFQLFERSAKSVRLTKAGRAFLEGTRSVLQRTQEAVSAARSVALGSRAELHVGYAPTPTARIMPAALRAFQAQMPNVRVRLHDLSTDEMAAGVREGRLQLALLVRPNPAMRKGLEFEELARERICLAVPPGHALARVRSVSVRQAARGPLVTFSRQDYPEYHEYLDALFAPGKLSPVLAEEHDSSASLIAAIESGSGLAVVPESFSCFAGTRLKLLPFKPAAPRLVIGALWPKAGLTPAGTAFLEAARAR